ncbi:MAG: N-acetyl-gamma-glutamyl-phosphate reductase [Candidatus Marinimicrobia bacterium]|nr:N-acetyl-gamma-glutamyl-phosphate reductase [Candidatus Neomarinimicrobiota bacterium]MCF7829485.1 N-acetyl-gamma-glutamyl-phosphate reductase [Candidatus Neomarinimicrobiota bacterium]MCF7880117.1 N-acetyl-gamma-glutamyl-phosphate reductase [Candidatus Neomarinimicrobiota bacterium]
MVQVGIIGGAGYTAGELLRILIHHPDAEIGFVHSSSQGGKPVTAIHTDLLGETELRFSTDFNEDVDVIFLCMGHGRSKEFLEEHDLNPNLRIIDLSQDYRVDRHPTREFVYGLPEVHREQIRETKSLANPGCFATTIQLGLLPLASIGKISNEVQITGITGSTGAGQKPRPTTHFSWRSENVSVYKAFTHQHLREIKHTLRYLQPDYSHDLNFVPVRGNFTRGILVISHLKSDLSLKEAQDLYQSYYESHPFIHLSDVNPNLKQVVNTNKGIVYLEKHDDNLMVLSMIDNLLKGASGQAVQNMNLMFGLDETAGLRLKSTAF